MQGLIKAYYPLHKTKKMILYLCLLIDMASALIQDNHQIDGAQQL